MLFGTVYDAYILGTTQIFDKQLFEEALAATAIDDGSSQGTYGTQNLQITALSLTQSDNRIWYDFYGQGRPCLFFACI